MAATHSKLISWCVAGPTTLHGFDDDLLYIEVRAENADPDLQRQVALVSAWDLEGERYAPMIAALPKLLAACQAVVANWEHGDLAEAARLCAEAVKMAMPDALGVQAEQIVPSRKTRSVEYYRLWGGDSGTWDTDFIDIPAETADDKLDEAIREAAAKIRWRDEPPVIVGCYNDGSEEVEYDGLPDLEVREATTQDAREQRLAQLVVKAKAAGMEAGDLDEAVHDMAASMAASVNNSGLEGQLGYLLDEMGYEGTSTRLDELAKIMRTGEL